MKTIKQRVAAFLLAVMMTVSGMPIEAFAAETTNSPPEEVESVLRLDNDKNKPLETENTTNEEPTEPEDIPSDTQDQPAIKEDAPEETEELDISEDKTSKDMDKQTAGEYTGPAHNSVISSDGKVQIRNFEAFWASIDEDTIVDTRDTEYDDYYKAYHQKSSFHSEPKIQINWALSGEVQYPKGAMTITIPDMQFEDENELKYSFKSYSIPEAKFKEDGSIDFYADYGNATLAYYYDKKDKSTKLVNILELAPGASGTFTLTYGGYASNSRWLKDMSIHKSRPTIDLKYKNETLKTQDKTLKIQQNTKFDANIVKIGNLYKTWQNDWGNKFKPENPEDYWYACYQIEMSFYDLIQTNLDYKLTDTLGDIIEYANGDDQYYGRNPKKIIKSEQEIIAYSDIYEKSDKIKAPEFLNHARFKDKIEWPVGNINLKKGEQKTNIKNFNPEVKHAYVLVKIPAKKLGYTEEKKSHYIRAYNNAKLEVILKNSNDDKIVKDSITNVKDSHTYAPNVDFEAPPGDMFVLQKQAGHTHSENGYLSGFHVDNGRNIYLHWGAGRDKFYGDLWNEYKPYEELYSDRDVSWRILGKAKVANATYDSKYDDPENPSIAYGRKKVRYELVDDYLYLADDYTKELTPEDYTVKSVEFSSDFMELYDYKQPYKTSKADYIGAYKDDIIIPASLYIRKTSTDEWEKAASFDMKTKYYEGSLNSNRMIIENFKGFIDGVKKDNSYWEGKIFIPEGYTSTKLVYETSFASINLKYQINGTLHPSKRVKDYIDKSKDNDYVMNIKLRNDSTFLAYDEDGNRLGLQGTTESSTNVDRTLELDRKNYDEEMYHSPVHLYLRQKPLPKLNRSQSLTKYVGSAKGDNKNKSFDIYASVTFVEQIADYKENFNYTDEDVREMFHVQNSGTFYDLLPIGVSGVKNVNIYDNTVGQGTMYYHCFSYYNKDTKKGKLRSNYKLIPNWRGSGRTLLVVNFDNAELSTKASVAYSGSSKPITASLKLSYTMIYPWDSYKDYGSKLERNLVAYESGFEKQVNDGLDDSLTNELESGYKDSNPGFYKVYNKDTDKYDKDTKLFIDQEIEWMKDLNPNNDEKRFLYAEDSAFVSGDTEANIGLTKHIKDERDSGFKLKTKTREGGHYQYKLRLQAAHATTVSNLIFFDSLENYDPLKADEDYGVKQWRGELESIDVTHPIMKGVDPKIYVSTIPKVDIEKHNDISDSTVWKPYKEGDDLSKVTGIAVDLRKNKDGSAFKLEQDTAINVYLNMKAPWDMKAHRIDPEAKALNAIFAKHTVSTSLDNKSDKLIYTAYTAIELEPVETEATIKAKKSYLDKEDKAIELKGDDFEFNLKDSNGKVLQTKTNDKDGNITFDPIKYHSWDVGEHTYTIEEVKGKDNKIAYDKHIETVKVKVERPEVSEIKASVEYDKDGSNFTNKEKKSASLQLIKLKADEEKFNLEEIKDKDGNLTSYKVPDADLGKTLDGAEYKLYKLNDGKEELVATLTTKNGISNVVEELEAGSYKLVETKAPSGYHLAEDALEFKITDEDAGKVLAKFVTDKGIEDLPSTGGRGTKIFIGIGTTLLGLMAGAMYLANKKKKQAISK